LLSQSDIFSHFGSSKISTTTTTSTINKIKEAPKEDLSNLNERSKREVAATTGFDDDEKAILNELADDGESQSKQNIVLLKQPSSIVGGEMRFLKKIYIFKSNCKNIS
jgi:hypothetical protein